MSEPTVPTPCNPWQFPAGNIIEAVEIGRVRLDPSNPDELGTWTSSWLPAVAPVGGADGRPH